MSFAAAGSNGQRSQTTLIGRVFRWVLVGWLFALLITSLVSMWEVLSFQQFVRSVSGDSERKFQDVLRAIDEAESDANSNEPTIGPKSNETFARLAYSVDSLLSAAEELRQFQGIVFEDAGNNIEAISNQHIRRLQDDVRRAEEALYTMAPSIQLGVTIKDLEKELSGLRRYTVTDERIDVYMDDELSHIHQSLNDQRDVVLQLLEDIKHSATGLEGEQAKTADGLVQEIAAQQLALDRLKLPLSQIVCQTASPEDVVDAQKRLGQPNAFLVESNLGPDAPKTEFAAARQTLNDTCESNTNERTSSKLESEIKETFSKNADDFETLLLGLHDNVKELTDMTMTDPDFKQFEVVLANLKTARKDYLDQVIVVIPNDKANNSEAVTEASLASPERQGLHKINFTKAQFEQRLRELQYSLHDRFNQYKQASAVTTPLVEIREAVAHLSKLKVSSDASVIDPETGVVQYGEAAAPSLSALQNKLTKAVGELNDAMVKDADLKPIALVLRENSFPNLDAQAIHNGYARLEQLDWGARLTPLAYPTSWGLDKWEITSALPPFQRIATMNSQSLNVILVLLLGALGSVIYMTKEELSRVINRTPKKAAREVYPISWYIFRPVFGAIVAFAVYLVYKTGQIALGAGTAGALDGGVNIPILSVFSMFAGLLAWQTLQMIEERGLSWIGSQNRRPLYATGLEKALTDEARTVRDCAAQIGRSVGQVERWIAGRDMVTPEMQDRISTWLGLDHRKVFDEKMRGERDRPRWAIDLRRHIDQHPIYHGVPVIDGNGHETDRDSYDELAERLGITEERLNAWMDGEQPVPASSQWQLVEILGMPHEKLFEQDDPSLDAWAIGLRGAIQANEQITVASLAETADVEIETLIDWMELIKYVPGKHRQALADALDATQVQLFRQNKPTKAHFHWPSNLRDVLTEWSLEDMQRDLNITSARLHAWLEADPVRGALPLLTARTLDKKRRRHGVTTKVDFVPSRGDLVFEQLTEQEREALRERMLSDGLKQVAASTKIEAGYLTDCSIKPLDIRDTTVKSIRDYLQLPPSDDRNEEDQSTSDPAPDDQA